MGVNVIPISTATLMASIAARPPSSAPSGFNATLATSMSGSAPEHAPSPSSATTATSAAKAGAKVEPKTDAKTDVKPDVKPGVASIPILDANLNSKSSANTASAPLLAVFEERGFSVLAPALADSVSNQQPLAPLSANLASVTAVRPLPISPAVALPAEIARAGFINAPPPGTPNPQGLKSAFVQSLNGTLRLHSGQALEAVPYPKPNAETSSHPGTPLLSGTTASPSHQPGPAATPAAASLVCLAADSRAAVLPAPNLNAIPAAVPPYDSGASNGLASARVSTEPGPKSSALPSATNQAASAQLSSNLPTQFHSAPGPFSTTAIPTGPISLAPTPSDSQVHAPVPAGAPTADLDQSPTMQ